MLKLSHTQILTYQSCRRLYRLQHLQGIRRKGIIIPLVVGRAVHAYLQAVREGLTKEQAALALGKEFTFTDAEMAMLTPDQRVQLDIEKHRAIAMMAAYSEAYTATDAAKYVNYITESHIEIPLIDGVTYHGYIDCLAKDAAGDWWIVEVKTAASGTVNADYFDRVKIDAQVAGYMELAKAKLGHYPRGILYDVVIKTRHSRKQGESHVAFVNRLTKLYIDEWKTAGLFERHELEVPASSVDHWRKDVELIAKEIRDAVNRKEKVWPKNTGNCLGKFGSCSMLPICSTGTVSKLLYDQKKSR